MQNGKSGYVDFHDYKKRREKLKLDASVVADEIIDLDIQVASGRRREERVFGEAFEQLVGISLRLSMPDENTLWQFALSPKLDFGEVESIHDVVDYIVGDECYEASTHLTNKKLDQVYKQLIAVRRWKSRRLNKYGRLNVVVLRKPPYSNIIWSRVRRDINVIELKDIQTPISDKLNLIGDALEHKKIGAADVERLSILLYDIHCDTQDGNREEAALKVEYLLGAIKNGRVDVVKYESMFGQLRHKSIPNRTCFYEDEGTIKQTDIIDRNYQYPEEKMAVIRKCWQELGENPEDFEMDPKKLRRVKRHLEGVLGKDGFYQSLNEEGIVSEELENNGTVTFQYSVFGVPIAFVEQKTHVDDIEAVAYNPDNGVVKVMHRNGLDTYLVVNATKLACDLAGHGLIVRGDFSAIYKKEPEVCRVDPLLIDRDLSMPNGLEQKDIFYEKLKTYILSNLN